MTQEKKMTCWAKRTVVKENSSCEGKRVKVNCDCLTAAELNGVQKEKHTCPRDWLPPEEAEPCK